MTSNPIPFISRAFARRKLRRRLHDLRCSVRYTLASDDDILKASAKLELHAIRDAIAMIPKNDFPALEHELPGLETRFQKAMPRPSFALHLRNFLDVLAVAGAVAFGIRALFLQPFQIPTSSMQPTLFGIHYMDAAESAPHRGPLTKFFHPFGASRATVRTQIGGHFQETTQPFSRGLPGLLPFLWDPADAYVSASGVRVGQEHFRLPGDDPAAHIFRYLDTNPLGADFQPGDSARGRLSVSCVRRVSVPEKRIIFPLLGMGNIPLFQPRSGVPRNSAHVPVRFFFRPCLGALCLIPDSLTTSPKNRLPEIPGNQPFSGKLPVSVRLRIDAEKQEGFLRKTAGNGEDRT